MKKLTIVFQITILVSMFFVSKNLSSNPILDSETFEKFSPGIEYKTNFGVTVFSMFDGEVYSASDDPNNKTNLGKFINIQHKLIDNDTSEKIDLYILYANLSEVYFKEKQQVKQGDIVGLTGNSSPIIKRNELLLCFYTLKDSEYLKRLCKSDAMFMWGVFWWNPKAIIDANNE